MSISVHNLIEMEIDRFCIILIICIIGSVSSDLDSLLALSDESSESSEPIDFTPVRIVDSSKPIHILRIDHCTLCGSFYKNAILISKAVFDENPNKNFKVEFGMKKGKI